MRSLEDDTRRHLLGYGVTAFALKRTSAVSNPPLAVKQGWDRLLLAASFTGRLWQVSVYVGLQVRNRSNHSRPVKVARGVRRPPRSIARVYWLETDGSLIQRITQYRSFARSVWPMPDLADI